MPFLYSVSTKYEEPLYIVISLSKLDETMSEAKGGAHFCYMLAQHKCELSRFIKNIF